MATPSTVAARVESARDDLRPAERRVAEVVLADPEAIAFGTVAEVARRAGTSGATVVRLADRLGYDGFVGLQADVQESLARRLRPATERIRERPATEVVARTLATELDNVHATLSGLAPDIFGAAVGALVSRRGRVFVLSGDAPAGVAEVFATHLAMLRPGVDCVGGSPVQVGRRLVDVNGDDVVVVIDVRRYDRWVLDAVATVAGTGATIVAVTDGPLSPLAAAARVVLTVSAIGAGPFDSHVATLALLNALVNGVAARLRSSATGRLDRVERTWQAAGALTDR